MPRWIWLRTRIGRGWLVFSSTVIALVVPLLFLDWFRILRQIPIWFYWKTELVLLVGIEALYGVTLLVAGSAFPVLAFLCLAGRRRGQPRPRAARLLLCAASMLIGLLAAEAVVFVQHRLGLRLPVLSVATEPDDTRKTPTGRLPVSSEKVALRQQFPDGTDNGRIDLVVLGESSAEGVPFQRWLSIGAIVKWQLENAIPGREVRLTILARSGDTLEKQHEALARLKRRPEILIVYCGHNEFLSRFFAFTDLPYYFLDQRPTGWDRFVAEAERFSPLCGLIRQSADRCRIGLPPPPTGRDLVDVPVFTTEEYSRILLDFRRRLEEIVSYASSLGTVPILISPPGNDADFEPNRSFLPAGTAFHERESFRRTFLETRRLEAVDPEASVKKYRELLTRAPEFAETHYRLATLLRKAGKWDDAYSHFISARDVDGYPMRCLSAFQEVYRDVAFRHDCIYIDGQAYFHTIGRDGLLGDELFQDAMHPSLRGQIALAQAALYALQVRRAFGWPADSSPRVIDPSLCAAHFGLGRETWEHAARWQSGFYGLVGGLRYDSSERSRRIDAFGLAADQIKAGSAPDASGLSNVGIPAPVPLVSGEGRRTAAAHAPAHEAPASKRQSAN